MLCSQVGTHVYSYLITTIRMPSFAKEVLFQAVIYRGGCDRRLALLWAYERETRRLCPEDLPKGLKGWCGGECGGAKGSESRLGAPVRGVNEQVTVEWDALGSGSALGQDKDLWINQPRGCCRLSFAENLLLSTES